MCKLMELNGSILENNLGLALLRNVILPICNVQRFLCEMGHLSYFNLLPVYLNGLKIRWKSKNIMILLNFH